VPIVAAAMIVAPMHAISMTAIVTAMGAMATMNAPALLDFDYSGRLRHRDA